MADNGQADIYALIVGSVVVNIVRASASFIEGLVDAEEIDDGVLINPGDPQPNISDSYDGEIFTPSEEIFSPLPNIPYLPIEEHWPELPLDLRDAIDKLAARLAALEGA